MPGKKLSAGIRPSDIMAPLRQNRMMHCARTNELPLRYCDARWKPATIRHAVIAPIGIVTQIFFRVSGFGPPAAKVQAHEMKIAHGGRLAGANSVVTASSEATISAGGFLMAFPLAFPWLLMSSVPVLRRLRVPSGVGMLERGRVDVTTTAADPAFIFG